MGEYRLRPRAVSDLDDIWEYTANAWGVDQAERYVLNYGKHLIFYVHESWGIDVVRILHGSRDVPAHFK